MDPTMTPGAPVLDPRHRPFVAAARRATLATTAPDGRPRLVPVCFVLAATDDPLGRPVVHTPLDEKPKRDGDPYALARVRDLLAVPQATLLVDRWDEDWRMLGWVRLYGAATLLGAAPADDEEVPAEDEEVPAEDEEVPAEDEEVPAEDEAPAEDDELARGASVARTSAGRAAAERAAARHAATERTTAIAALREKYPQYRTQRLEARPIIRLAIERVVTWGAVG